MRTRLPLLFASAVALTACGGGGGGGGNTGPSPSPPAPVDRVVLTATAPTADVGSGSDVPFEFVVTNPSDGAAANVSLTTTLGSGLSPGVMTCDATGGATCPASGSTSIASLPAKGSLRFRMNALLASGSRGAISSTASVTADNDGVTTNNLAQVVINAFSADVRVTGSTNVADSIAGSVLVYSMTVSNVGPDPARDIRLDNGLSTGQALVSMTCAASGGAACPAAPANSMNIASLPNGAALTFTLTTSIDQDAVGNVSNTLRATGVGDPMANNNAATASSTVQIPISRQTPSFIVMKSDAGDVVGGGNRYSFDGATSTLRVTDAGGYVKIEISGSQNWVGEFALPVATQLAPGMYDNAVRYPPGLFSSNAMNVSIGGRACNSLTGSFRIDNATYMAGVLAVLDLRFEQYCQGAPAALRGQIHWVSANLPPGPVNPPPPALWAPPAGATPTSGNYVYLESDPGDWVGDGQRHVYTQANSVLTLQPLENKLSVFVNGFEHWSGDFQAMASIDRLEPGYYGNLGRYAFGNPWDASMAWTGEGHGCNDIAGWFVVDSVTYSGTALASIDLRFEQHCDGAGTALRGKVHWTNGDTTQPPGPQVPPPAGLWQPALGQTPSTGNYVYLLAEPGYNYTNGAAFLYTQADSKFRLESFGAQFSIYIQSYESYSGSFVGMNTLQRLQVGYYGDLQRAGLHNPTKGGIDFGGGCNRVTGWFVIDSIAYTDGAISAIDLRFTQYCEDRPAALRGKIHWAPGDTTNPPGPVTPVPAGLWQPAPGATPATGNYVYLESDAGDYVGQGETHTLTQADAQMEWRMNGNGLRFLVWGDTNWDGEFMPMDFLTQLQPGFYDNLLRAPYHNPVVGGLTWSGEGRGCNESYSWLAVDNITYVNGAVDSIDLRFEQYCEYEPASLRGKVHWRSDDPTRPPGPVNPPPAGLWTPPPGSTPATGNYVYLESSSPADFIGHGMITTLAPTSVTTTGTTLNVRIGSVWTGKFVGMNFLTQLQPGYYGGLARYPLPNPVKGDVDWSGDGRGCNFDEGWFSIDNISYEGGTLKSVDLRFEQRCEGYMPPLHGQIHWIAP